MNKFMVHAAEWCDLFSRLMGDSESTEAKCGEDGTKAYEKEGNILGNASFLREEYDENGDMTYRHIEEYKNGKCVKNETLSKDLDNKGCKCGCNGESCECNVPKDSCCKCNESKGIYSETRVDDGRKTRVRDLKDKIQTLEEDNKALKNINMEMAQKIDDLVDDCKKLTEECNKLTAENKKYYMMTREIKNTIKTWEK